MAIMKPERFLECLEILHWSQRGFAADFGISDRQVRRWGTGVYPIPEEIGDWLEKLAQFHVANPRPRRPPIRAYYGPVAQRLHEADRP
jgi:hypothetical protein